MRLLAPILLAQLLLRREPLTLVGAESPDQKAQPAASPWPLKECAGVELPSGQMKPAAGCVCQPEYQVCQPLQLSAAANGSVTLRCTFAFHPSWGALLRPAQVRWRLRDFHSLPFLFTCCGSAAPTQRDFEGRVSLARGRAEEGSGAQPYTASIRITALRESDAQLYFCRVSVETAQRGKQEWQSINGTNLTVTAPEGGDRPTTPVPLGLLAGLSTGAVLLAAALLAGLAAFLLARRKGHGQKRTQTRRAARGGQEAPREEGYEELHCRGARAPPREKPAAPPPPPARALGEPGLLYASLVLSEPPPDQKRPLGRRGSGSAEEEQETTYAAVRP